MKVTESKFDIMTVLGPADFQHDRSSGLHLSQIYFDIENTAAPKNNNFTPDELQHYRAMGFMWEWVVSKAMAQSLEYSDLMRPGEVTHEGVIGSPDLIHIPTWTVVDTKATWRSLYKLDNLEKFFWSWLVQLKGYCRMMETNKARLLVFGINGNYRPPVPQTRRLDIEFTSLEIKDNWSMLMQHARRRGWIK